MCRWWVDMPHMYENFHTRERWLRDRPQRCMPAFISMRSVLILQQREEIDQRWPAEKCRLHAIGWRRHHAELPVLSEEGSTLPILMFTERGHLIRRQNMDSEPFCLVLHICYRLRCLRNQHVSSRRIFKIFKIWIAYWCWYGSLLHHAFLDLGLEPKSWHPSYT